MTQVQLSTVRRAGGLVVGGGGGAGAAEGGREPCRERSDEKISVKKREAFPGREVGHTESGGPGGDPAQRSGGGAGDRLLHMSRCSWAWGAAYGEACGTAGAGVLN